MNDDQRAELRALQTAVEANEDEGDAVRRRRDDAICVRRQEGDTVQEIADAVGLSRQTVHTVLRTHSISAPARTRRAVTADRVRSELARLLGLDQATPDQELIETVRSHLDHIATETKG